MLWKPPKIWKDGECWIMGGGPSIVKEFEIPQSVVNSVMNEGQPISCYSPYLSPIHNKHVIGINAAYKLGDWFDIIFFGDLSFWRKHLEYLLLYPSLKVTCTGVGDKWKGVKWMRIDPHKKIGINTNRGYVCWHQNSGVASISLAAQLGVKRIILLGFDMKLEDDKQHWHNIYRGKGMKATKIPFDYHLQAFPAIAKDAKKLGIEIINANPDSAIDCFKKANVKELI